MQELGDRWCWKDAVRLACELQQMEEMYDVSWGMSELMRLAVTADREGQENVFGLCRMLFKSKTSDPLRKPVLGKPGLIGEASLDELPDYPFHYHGPVLFHVARGYTLAGRRESASEYLAYCIRHGEWNIKRFAMTDDDSLVSLANEFVDIGPWHRPLNDDERDFVIDQIRCDWRKL